MLIALAGCEGADQSPRLAKLVARTAPTDVKVLLIGIDGGSFRVLDPLLEQGRLPHMKRLIDGGVRGVLKSDPPMFSPAIWTSVVTGRNRQDHGIVDFMRRPRQLVRSNDRKVTALWNWLGAFGKTVGFHGWWASWPAEPVNGWIVSECIARTRMTEWTEGERDHCLTFPPDLAAELRPLRVDPAKPDMDEIAALVEFDDAEKLEFLAAKKPVYRHWLSVFKFAYCAQRSFENIALHMMDKGQPDLTGIYLIANDPICHTFWHFYEPDAFEGVDPAKATRLGVLPSTFSEHNDEFIGRLLAKVDENTVVLIVSDHGFQASDAAPEDVPQEKVRELRDEMLRRGVVAIGQSSKHNEKGILIACGGPIRKGVAVQAHVFDITPTILALMGLPVAEDMAGRVLTEILEPEFVAAHPVQTIPSYDDYFEKLTLPVTETPSEEEMIDQLRALGYVK